MSELELETLLEAILFGSGKSLSVKELSESLGYDEEEVSEALTSLQGTLKRRRGGALRIVEIGGKWAMEVRPNVADHLPKETKTEMPKKLLKAAALI
ncbi:MAG: SMC-Scp complex subunit ScpB, partial [Candidatus Poseidoniaceae archaeon]